MGYCAYWIYGFKSLSSIKPYQAIITTDNQTFEGRFIFGCVSNSTSIGGILKLADQKVDLCDGRMELLLIRYPKSPAELGQLIFDVARGNYSNKNIIFTQAERISVRFQNDVDWSVDGEYAGKYQQTEILVKHKAFKILRNA